MRATVAIGEPPLSISSPDVDRFWLTKRGEIKRIFGMRGSVAERQKGLGLVNQFLPNNVVDIAHRTYQQLA